MAPVVHGLIPDYENDVVFKILNAETSSEGRDLANEFGVQFVPTFVFVDSSGEEVNRMVGAVSESQLRQQLDTLD